MGADFVATGHYAKLERKPSHTALMIPKDLSKDQTYFLSHVRPEALSKCLFPLAEVHKSEVRQIAAQADLPSALRKDSYGICFVGKRKMKGIGACAAVLSVTSR